jgi:hypothetical protein
MNTTPVREPSPGPQCPGAPIKKTRAVEEPELRCPDAPIKKPLVVVDEPQCPNAPRKRPPARVSD